jgi:uncharacterized protein YegP (UPF0339 family)
LGVEIATSKTRKQRRRAMFFKLSEEATPEGTQWAFSIKTEKHEILAQSSSYPSREAALTAIDTIRKAAAHARIEDHGAEGMVGHP